MFKEGTGEKSILFTCSTDGFVKLWSINDYFKNIAEIDFKDVSLKQKTQ